MSIFTLSMNELPRNESAAWHDVYRSPVMRARRAKTHRRKLAKLGLLALPRDAAVLDVCCGTGEMLDILAQEGFSRLTGVDLEKMEADQMRPWNFVKGSAGHLPFPDETFDVIYCAHALHHLGSFEVVQDFWTEAFRCLKRGGRLAVVDHYDSIQLRSVFGLWGSFLGKWLPGMRAFHFQLVEEKTYLYRYLNSWKRLNFYLSHNAFQNGNMKKDLFFFYWNGFKPHE